MKVSQVQECHVKRQTVSHKPNRLFQSISVEPVGEDEDFVTVIHYLGL